MLTGLLLLVAEFLLGMWVNLFITIPQHPGENDADYFKGFGDAGRWALDHGALGLRLHVAVGLILGVVAIVATVTAIRSHRIGWIVWSVLGLVGVLAAGFNGGGFLVYNENVSSMIMSGGFALAMVSYVAALAGRTDPL